MMGNKIRINLSIDNNILEVLDKMAAINGMSRSAYVTKLVIEQMWEGDYYLDLPLNSPKLKALFDE